MKPLVELTRDDWRALVKPYQTPDNRLAAGQVLSTLGLLVACLWLGLRLLAAHWALPALLAPLTGGLLVRLFIIQHDCGHGSFTTSRWWNDALGRLCSLLTLTPYHAWRRDHAVHHATSGNLDERGTGDIKTLTVAEYLALPRWRQRYYRLYRSVFGMFLLGPTLHFVIFQRFTGGLPADAVRERRSVHATNLALLLFWGGLVKLLGWSELLFVVGPALVCAASAGVWLFYVQHQFDEAYWVPDGDWSYSLAALEGSSHYRLPKPLQWLTGNIGLHHIHHLSPRIPNYRLQACHDENPLFAEVKQMTLRESLATIPLALWDPVARRLISFRELDRQAEEGLRQAA